MQCHNKEYAGFGVRSAAFIVDSFIIGMATGIIGTVEFFVKLAFPDSAVMTPILFDITFFGILAYLVKLAYFTIMTFLCGRTIGKMVFKLRVIDKDDEKLSFWSVLYRESIGRFLSGVCCGIGYIIIVADKQKQGFHDMLSDTRVVYDLEDKKADKVKSEDEHIQTEDKTSQNEIVQAEDNKMEDKPVQDEQIQEGSLSKDDEQKN